MELRLLHAAAHRQTWYGRWGFVFGRGGFAVGKQVCSTWPPLHAVLTIAKEFSQQVS